MILVILDKGILQASISTSMLRHHWPVYKRVQTRVRSKVVMDRTDWIVQQSPVALFFALSKSHK